MTGFYQEIGQDRFLRFPLPQKSPGCSTAISKKTVYQSKHTDMNLSPALARILPGGLAADRSVAALLAANIITIVIAILENWDLATVMFIYWAQSIIIGVFTVITLFSADTAALAADLGKSQAEHGGSALVSERYVGFYKILLAGFFALHYGLFHWGYYSFIIESGLFGPVNLANAGIWVSCGLFFVNHLYSYLYHRGSGRQGAQFLAEEFVRPYHRIIPMHLTIIFGSIVVLALQILGITTVMPVLVLFLVLKTYSDIGMHRLKHREEAGPDEPVQLIGT
jgi:hypothetical protein